MATLTTLFDPRSGWRSTPVQDLPSWDGVRRVAIDVETRDDDLKKHGIGVRRGGYIVGIAFAFERGPAYYLPIRHEGGDNLPEDLVLEYLRDQAQAFQGDIIGANLSYDLDYLAEERIRFRQVGFYRDIQVAEPLIDEHKIRYSLESISKSYGLPGKYEEDLKMAAVAYSADPKAELWRLPARHVGRYAEFDVQLPLMILRRQEQIIENQDLWQIYDLESQVLPVLVAMRRRGVLIDWKKLEEVERVATERERAALGKLHDLTGVRVDLGDVWRPGPIAKALSAIGFEVPLTPTGKPSTKVAVVEKIDHPAAKEIGEARRWNKLRTTFVESIRRHAIRGRIHCTFNQLRAQKEQGGLMGPAYGRLSSVNPNLQQQPKRDEEIGPFWRSIYIPDPGGEWASLDYSQQEPRMTVHYAVRRNCNQALTAAERYRNDPNMDNHQMMADMAGIERKAAKAIFLGLCLSKGTPVFTSNGLKPIEFLTQEDLLWDGGAFAKHGGVISTGEKRCLKIGDVWMTPDHEILTPEGWFQARDLNTLNLRPGWYTENSPWKQSNWGREEGLSPSSAVARVVEQLIPCETTSYQEKRHAVLSVVKRRLLRHIHNTDLCQSPIVVAFLVELVRSFQGVFTNLTEDMDDEELLSTNPGSVIDGIFFVTWSRYRDGIIHHLRLTESTTKKVMCPETYDSSLTLKTCRTLDVVNAGPLNRFAIADGLVVSNCYGMGGAKLCRELKLPTRWVEGRERAGAEGEALFRKFNLKVPFVKELARQVEQRAAIRGYIKTICGRRCRFPKKAGKKEYDWTYKALNRLIQGSSADQTKTAMVEIEKAGYKLQLQIHDEVDLTVMNRTEAEQIAEIMENCTQLEVPSLVDVEIGPSWGGAK